MGGRRKIFLASGLALIALALLSVPTSAECPNGCSGNGACMNKDMCQCYKNFQGNDCMDRTCQFGYAHADTPKGDINYDQNRASTGTAGWLLTNSQQAPAGTYEYFNNDAANDEAHFYMECSNKGLCDRSLGTCTCFDGYEGVACQRAACPNKCSGHGTCESIRELGLKTKGTLFGIPSYWDSITYDLWDSRVTYGCRCDPWYHGSDCSLRSCKVGVDPMFTSTGSAVNEAFAVHVYTTATKAVVTEPTLKAGNNYFRLRLFDYHGEAYITDPITILNDFDPNPLTAGTNLTQTDIDNAIQAIVTTTGVGNPATAAMVTAAVAIYTANAKANAAAVAAAIKKIPNQTFQDVMCEPTGIFTGDYLLGYTSSRAASSRGLSVVCQFTKNPGRLRRPEVAAYDFSAVIDPALETYSISTREKGMDDEWFTVAGDTYTGTTANPITINAGKLILTANGITTASGAAAVDVALTLFKIGTHVVVGSYTAAAKTITMTYPFLHTFSTTSIQRFDAFDKTVSGFAVTEFTLTAGAGLGDTVLTVTWPSNTDPAFTTDDFIFYENQFYKLVSRTKTVTYSATGPAQFQLTLGRPFAGNSLNGGAGTILKAYEVTPPSKDYRYNYVSPCSGRGLCTTETGICACFKGYTNDNCDTQNILAL